MFSLLLDRGSNTQGSIFFLHKSARHHSQSLSSKLYVLFFLLTYIYTQSSFPTFSAVWLVISFLGIAVKKSSNNFCIWSANHAVLLPAEEGRNLDCRASGASGSTSLPFCGPVNDVMSDFNLGFSNDVRKAQNKDNINVNGNCSGFGVGSGLDDDLNIGIYISNSSLNFNSYRKGKNFDNDAALNAILNKGGGKIEEVYAGKLGKKKSKGCKGNKDDNVKGENKSVDKRFKTLSPGESLPRNETVGGFIFVCNNDTMAENLKRQLFGLPPRYRDSVRAITPGLPLFLYNYSTRLLHGIFEAAGFGGSNIDPSAWEDKKTPGESRFPAQVRVLTRKECDPLEEDSFRPILHHYDGPKFRLQLNVPEALSLLDIYAEDNP